MTSTASRGLPPVITALATAILLLSLWALGFSHSCTSDGCIGIIFPAGGAAMALAIELLVAIPVLCVRRHRAGLAFARAAGTWAAISIAAFVLPLLFVK